MVGSTTYSLAKECKRLCKNEIKINGVKQHRKCRKNGRKYQNQKRNYHLQDKDNVKMVGINTEAICLRKKIEVVFHPCIILDVT